MEKFVNILKGLAIFIVVALIGFFIYDAFTRTAGFFNTVASWFDNTPIVVDPYKNATSNVIPFTKEEVEAQITNPECPNMGDITDKIYIQEYNDVVVFYKESKDQEGKTFYPNLLFLKTEQGLIYNGCTNLHAEAVIWFGNQNSFTWQPNFYEKPFIPDVSLNSHRANFVIYSSGYSDTFVDYGGLFNGGFHEYYLNRARDYVNANLLPYFLSFYNNNIKIWQNEGSELADFNAFYDYIYRSYKTGAMSGTIELKSPDFVTWQIPVEEQSQYPMNETANFEFYNFNFFLEYFSTKDNRFLININWQDDVDANVEVIETKTIEEEPSTIPTVVFKLSDGKEFNVDNLLDLNSILNATIERNKHLKARAEILQENPVSFKIFQNNEYIKEIVFDTFEDLRDGISLNLRQGEYTYTLSSNAFVFDYTFGNLIISQNATFVHKYSYMEDSVVVSVGLKPTSTGYTDIILMSNPVSISFLNKETKETFSLIFNGTVPSTKTLILPFGTYAYVISSDLLEFSPRNGEFTVSATNHSFIFEYYISSSSGFVLDGEFGESDVLSIRIPTVETENGFLNCNNISEVWIYHIDSIGYASIKKITNVQTSNGLDLIVSVPYSELSDNFGTTNSTYQLRIFYGEKSYFTTTIQGDSILKNLVVSYSEIVGI